VIEIFIAKSSWIREVNMHFLKSFALFSAVILTVILVTACASDVARITVEGMDNHTFVPNAITVNSGQTVELTLVNNGKLDHTFTISDLNIEVIMRAGETNHITITAPKRGEYVFSSGANMEFDTMKGALIVK
jgi:plastocyanin